MAIGGWNPVHLDGLGDTDANFCLSPHTSRATTLDIRNTRVQLDRTTMEVGGGGGRTVTLKLCTPVEFISSRKLARELSV